MDINNNLISFCRANTTHVELVKIWFSQDYIQEFWGNDGYTWNNFLENVLHGKKELFDYYIALYDNEPYALLLTSDASEDTPTYMQSYIEVSGSTYTLDFLKMKIPCDFSQGICFFNLF